MAISNQAVKRVVETRVDERQDFKTTLRQFRLISRAFFGSERRRKARGYLIALLLFALAVGGVQVLMSYAGRDFFTAIARKQTAAYWTALGWYLGTFALAVPVGVYYRWLEERLALLWREWMTQHLVKRYFNNRAYFRLRDAESVDNPDQRISEDVRNFTTSSLSFLLIGLNSLVTLIAFIGVIWTISGMLVFILIAYATIGTVVSFLVGRQLVRLYYYQYKSEANFRYGLVRLRDHAESIAFYRGEKREHLDLFNRLAAAVGNMHLIIVRNRKLAFFTNSYHYFALVIPLLVVGPVFMRGDVEFGVVTQTAGAFAQVLAAVSLVVSQFGGISTYLASIQRLGSLWDQLDEHDSEEQRIVFESKNLAHEASQFVKLDKLDICAPGNGRILVRALSFELHRNQSLMIMGPSGTGKSSVLRTIAGLWPGNGGSLERPAFAHLMFLPQRPYMVEGSLRDQLLYPYPDRGITDEEIRKVVTEVNLTEILVRVEDDLDGVLDWGNLLSLGEQQRIAFARLFLRKPKFAFLDESTSALDEENQATLYDQLRRSGISFISVGHRTTLIQHHDSLLRLDRSGAWEIFSGVRLEGL